MGEARLDAFCLVTVSAAFGAHGMAAAAEATQGEHDRDDARGEWEREGDGRAAAERSPIGDLGRACDGLSVVLQDSPVFQHGLMGSRCFCLGSRLRVP